MRRKRRRRKRKKVTTSDSEIEPEFLSIWNHSAVGDLFALSPVLTLDTTATPSLDTEPPTLYPQVDWTQVNPRSHKSLPEPESFPIHGCFHIPPSNSDRYYPSFGKPDSTYEAPYGQLQGFLTEDGVIPLGGHDQTIHGYIWSDLYNKWVLRNTKREKKEESGVGLRSTPSTPLRCSTPRTSTSRTRTVWTRPRGR